MYKAIATFTDGTKEWDVIIYSQYKTMRDALDGVKRFTSKGYNVVMTRKDDTFVSLEDRVNISENEAPQIFVSIHVNSAVSKEPYGSETHYYHEYSKELATVVNKHLI